MGLLVAYVGSIPPSIGNPCASGYCASTPPLDNTFPLILGVGIFLAGLLMVFNGFRHIQPVNKSELPLA
jgi:hypothetical protein